VRSPLLVGLVKAGRLGCKSKGGFYGLDPAEEDGPVCMERKLGLLPDQCVARLIAEWSRSPGPQSPQSIAVRLLLPMVVEASRILEEGKVGSAGEIDLAVIFGLGFPAWRGGLLWWADSLGAGRIEHLLQGLAGLGSRAPMTSLLSKLARDDGTFYGIAKSRTLAPVARGEP
jgi:3-hydroxyacyl-CoA dehydrogenase